MVLNADKDTDIISNNLFFSNSNEEKIFGISIDNKLTFKNHIKNEVRNS